MRLALAMIVRGVDSEASVLDRCLHYATNAVDGIFITVTHEAGELPSQKVLDVCNKYGAVISEFQWIKDFAAARNFNFSTVSLLYDYILWLDADDVLKDSDESVGMGSNLKQTIEAHPEADVFSMFYLYSFDEHGNATVVHQKTRVIKNDYCVEWYGNGIHEDFRETREITRFAIKGIDVVHISDDERLEYSRFRNYDIALHWAETHSDDPRSYWNLGNSAFGVQKYEEALKAFDIFLERSRSDEEKYIARLRRADVYWSQGNNNMALDEARYAIGLRPEYPDAFHAAGRYFYALGQFERAKDMILNGLTRPAPYYQILVYNPREYDYTPLMNLAKCYYALNLPQLALPAFEAAVKIVPADEALKKTITILRKEAADGEKIIARCAKLRKITDKEKLKQQLDKIPAKYRFHPEVLRIRNTNFVKTQSSGKDVVIFCGFTEEEWTPETIAKKGSGGSEEAAITMAQGLADKGWNVTVYNSCGTEESAFQEGHKVLDMSKPYVTYKPYMSWNYRDKQDVTILWRQTKPLDWEINSTKIYVDMHDVIPAGEFTPARIDRITKVFFKSNYHRNLYRQISDDKTVVIPNGINPNQFSSVVQRDPNLLINTSSPVRALTALIDIMKEVRKEVPEAKMKWAYGWETTDGGLKGDPDYPAWKKKTLEGLKEAGIESIGRLNHEDIAKLYQEASLFVYPTGFPEIDCISLSKAYAAGCFPICTDYAALGEKAEIGEFVPWNLEGIFHSWDMAVPDKDTKKKFVALIVRYLKTPPSHTTRYDMQAYGLNTWNWDRIIDKWDTILNA